MKKKTVTQRLKHELKKMFKIKTNASNTHKNENIFTIKTIN